MRDVIGTILVADESCQRGLHVPSVLADCGFAVEEAPDAEQALAALKEGRFDAILLDVLMPRMGGIAACAEARRSGCLVPILMVSTRNNKEELLRAFDAGADDYIVKPFDPQELAARLRVAVRRSRGEQSGARVLTIGSITLDADRRTVAKNQVPIHLTPREFALLQYLMMHSGIPIPHSKLLQAVWGPEYGSELEYLRTFIRQLRVKLEDNPAHPSYLLTDPYVGYRFRAQAQLSSTPVSNLRATRSEEKDNVPG